MTMLKIERRSQGSRLFPGFFFGGFECSTPINFDRVRIDELALTSHDRLVWADYRRLSAAGIRTVRDGVRWNRIDTQGRLDFSSALDFVRAAEAVGMTVIWDLFHYGYPDDLDPFSDLFIERFCSYCHAFARMLVQRGYAEQGPGARGLRFYTPVNEISFFAWAGGEVGMFAPHRIGYGAELKRRLAQTAIAGVDAIRRVDPSARFVHCDPVVRVTAPRDAPWLQDDADYFNAHFVSEAWDMLAGRIAPELGGSPDHLDIVGVNYYGVNQWEYQRHESVLAEDDPRRVPFSILLQDLYARYRRPMIVAETSSTGDDRARWLQQIARQCQIAMAAGVDLPGLCIYPVIGMADWHTSDFRPMGLWDRAGAAPDSRVPVRPLLSTLRSLQRAFEATPQSAFRREAQTTHAAAA